MKTKKGSGFTPDPFVNYGGAEQDRTVDLLNAIQALSQLSYSPIKGNPFITKTHSLVNHFFTDVEIPAPDFFLDPTPGIRYNPSAFAGVVEW